MAKGKRRSGKESASKARSRMKARAKAKRAAINKVAALRRSEATRMRLAEAEARRGEWLRAQQNALVDLAKNEAFHGEETGKAFRAVTEIAAQAMPAGRASVWLYNEDRSAIRLVDLYELTQDRHSAGDILFARDYPAYFRAIETEERAIDAHDAHTDPRTREYSESYLTPLGIGAMLDAPIRLRGRVVGVLCHEHLGGPRTWTPEEQSFAGSLATMVSLAMEAHERRKADEALRESEELFRTAFEATAVGMVLLTPDGRFLHVNRFYCEMLGFTEEELLTKTFLDVTHPDDREVNLRMVTQLLAGEVPSFHMEKRYLHKLGGEVWAHVSASSVRDALGRPLSIIAQVQDITERKRAEELLRDSRALLQTILENSPTMIFVKDLQGRYLLSNREFEKITHRPHEQSRGKTDDELFLPEQSAAFRANDLKVIQASVPLQFEEVAIHDDGPRTSIVQKFPLRNATGEIWAIGGIVTDITERKRAEQQILTEKEFSERLINSSVDGILAFDRQCRYIVWNPGMERISGVKKQETLGKCAFEVFPFLKDIGEDKFFFDALAGKTVAAKDRPYMVPETGRQGFFEGYYSPLCNESGEITGGLAIIHDITEHKRIDEALRLAEEKYRSIFENAVEGIFQTTADGCYISANPALAHIYGYESPEEMIAAVTDIRRQVYVDPDRRNEFRRMLEEQGAVTGFEAQVYRKDGSVIWISESARAVCDEQGTLLCYEGTVEDITERKRLEQQLLQAQKMEAVGRLAGGIAHDFNNLLTAILGYSVLLLSGTGSEELRRRNTEQIKKAAERAAALTRQLLAFSRRQVLTMKVLDLNDVVAALEPMLRRLIGEEITLVTVLDRALEHTKADVGQIEQVIMNLVVNARDAMPQGGTLTIETVNVELDQAYADQHGVVPPGTYVMLTVSDTGYGMDAETCAHIFEPFFTTKEQGKGTGLGLSTVYGIVKQSDGYIWVSSDPGRGTTFKVCLPRVDEAVEAIDRSVVSAESSRGTEAILLVEDDEVVRALAGDVLGQSGYTVLVARHSDEAFRLHGGCEGPIHLLITDVVMPGMGGRELAERLKSSRPAMKVLFMSGYTDDAVVRHGVLEEEAAYLQKPFTPDVLRRKVREVLDESFYGVQDK